MKPLVFLRLLILSTICLSSAIAHAHFNILLPSDYHMWHGRKDRATEFKVIWGHGYEHIWFDAEVPEELIAVSPSGEKTNLLDGLKKSMVTGRDGKDYRAFSLSYRPKERGDHIIAMKAALVYDREQEVYLQDYAKSIFHVQDKLAWDRNVGMKLELVPLTRPYGLQVGGVFQAQVLLEGKPLAACEVEFEKYQRRAPSQKDTPPETFITFEAKTDPNGIVTFGLHEEGWFALTAINVTKEHAKPNGVLAPIVERSTLWINIAETWGNKETDSTGLSPYLKTGGN
ncbi:DUF4198 domain-containing protein [Candidatus Hydrogenedentota bacterium]